MPAPHPSTLPRPRIALWLMLLCGLPACTPPAEQARLQLQKQGIPITSQAAVDAARAGKVSALEMLRTAGIDPAVAPDENSPTPLIAAIEANSGAIPFLLSATPDGKIDTPDATGRTALSHAVATNTPALAIAILQKSANPASSAHPNQDIISDALSQHQQDLVSKLIASTTLGAPLLDSSLLTATTMGNTSAVQQLLARQANPGTITSDGKMLVDIAADQQDLPTLTLLVEAGARAPSPSSPHANPLRHAVRFNNLEMARLLIKAGYHPDAHDGAAGTPTGLAASQRRLPLLELFLEKSADPQPHLQSALIGRDFEVVDMLITHGADVNVPNATGDTPIIQAVLKKDLEMTHHLLGKKPSLDSTGALGQTAFAIALALGSIEMTTAFLESGADANACFCSPAKQEFLDLTHDDYFNKWMQKDELLTPLMLAASRGDLPLMRLLLKHGAKRGSQTRDWKRYPVNFACEQSHIPAAQLLLGQDPDAERDVKAIVSLSKQRAYIYKDGKVVRSSDVSTGKTGFTTPSGKYVISDKQADWKSSIYKVPMPFFMRLSCKDFGLHAGVVHGGSPASHGCVRLPKDQAEAFFNVMQIGDPVIIEN